MRNKETQNNKQQLMLWRQAKVVSRVNDLPRERFFLRFESIQALWKCDKDTTTVHNASLVMLSEPPRIAFPPFPYLSALMHAPDRRVAG